MKLHKTLLAAAVVLLASGAQGAVVTLGAFNFDSNQFGNTLVESDGGTFRNANWLNTANANPGNPGALTGANFDTGIANIGLGSTPTYTIGYNTAIVNGAGNDLGIVSARFSTGDTFTVSVSTDGINFSSSIGFGPGLAVSTGVGRSYFYGGAGPFSSTLFVTPIDLSAFGIGNGSSIVALRITGSPEADLVRVAGFGGTSSVPEPATVSMLSAGIAILAFAARRRVKAKPASRLNRPSDSSR